MGQRIYAPAWLYEALPYLYAGIGVLAIAVIRNPVAIVAGVMLIAAGGYVWAVRRQHRSGLAPPVPTRAATRPVNADRGLRQLVWRDIYATGSATVDEQHRQLFVQGNALIAAALAGSDAAAVEALLDALVDQMVDHFCSEEAILTRLRHPLCAAHRETHRGLLARTRAVTTRFRARELPVRDMIDLVVYDIVANHIVNDDFVFTSDRSGGPASASPEMAVPPAIATHP